MTRPTISIGMPVFNGEDFLRQSVCSILDQDYADFELIISDNASTDRTEAICRELAASDARIRYYRNECNLGASANYNRVFELAKGKYFKWAAHDDECHRSMLRRCVETLESTTESVVMVYPLAELIDEEGRMLGPVLDRIACKDPKPRRRVAHLLRSLCMCDPVFGVYKSNSLKKTGGIGPFFGADYVLLGELAMMGEIVEIEEVLFRLRQHKHRSMEANPSARARAAWYDPAAIRKWCVLPDWEQMVWHLIRAVWRSGLPLSEKVICSLTIPAVHYTRRIRNRGGRLKFHLKTLLGIAPTIRKSGAP